MNKIRPDTRYFFLFLFYFFPGQLPAQSIFDTSRVHRLVLEVDLPGWADTLMMYKKTNSKRRIGANLILDGKVFDPVGIRYKGNSSFFNFAREEKTKLPFNLNMKYFVKDQSLESGITKLKLSNNYRDLSYIREMLARTIVSRYVHIPEMGFAEVYANDTYLGLYTMVEGLEDEFLKRQFGTKKGTLVKCDPVWKSPKVKGCKLSDNASLEYLGENIACYRKWYDLKSKRGWSDLIKLTRIIEQYPESVDSVLDVYSTLWMLALNNTLVNLDSYTGALGHNYYLFKPEGGVFMPLMWDLNLSFGGFQIAARNQKIEGDKLSTLDPLLHAEPPLRERPLISKLLAQPLYRKVYLSMIHTILDDFFTGKDYLKIAQQFHALISGSVRSEEGRVYAFEDFEAAVHETMKIKGGELIGIAELMEERTKFLLRHPAFRRGSPGYQSHIVTPGTGTQQVNLRTTDAERAWLYYRSGRQVPFQKLEMQLLEQGRWQAVLDSAEGSLDCFFVLENEDAALIWPDRAPKITFTIGGK